MSGYGESFDPDPIVVIQGEEPSPRRSRDVDDKVIADRVRAQQEAVEIQKHRLRQERSIADSNYRWHVAEEEKAQHDLRAAIDSGDTERQVEAQTRIGQLSHGKEEARKNLNAWNARAEPEQYTERTMRWFAEHPEFQSGALRQKAVGAHMMAVADGMVPDSDQYFQHCEATLGVNGASRRSSGGARSSGERRGGNSVTLTPGEVQRSEDGSLVFNVGERDHRGEVIKAGDPRIGRPIGRETFAYRKLGLQKQGYYSRLG
jgi:hypothetical protein